jgi:superfamily II DNA or RNA helicase
MANSLNFEDWELRHLRKRADEFGLDDVSDALTAATDASQKTNIDPALERLASITGFDKTCFKQDCDVCPRVTHYGQPTTDEPWQLTFELYRWQKECKERWWDNGGGGIVKVVTGAGKTVLALGLVSEVKQQHYQDQPFTVITVVPNTALLDQWYEEYVENLNLPEDRVGVFYGEEKNDITDHDVIIYVLNSARMYLSEHLDEIGEDVFFIADECHSFASEKNSEVFDNTFDYKIGLSATPERKADYGFEEKLVPNLGDIIYNYSYPEAREDGIIPPYRLKRIKVPLQLEEERVYEEFSEKLSKLTSILINRYPQLESAEGDEFIKEMGRLQKKTDDEDLTNYTILTNQRKAIVHESASKLAALKHIVEKDIPHGSRTLVFHERTESADKIHEFLQDNGYESGIYHTKIPPHERRENLRKYREGDLNILVTCRALDEGLDVPDTNIGIIAAATSSVRQRIQRIGRILRKSPGKDYSQIYTIYIAGKESKIFNKPEMQDMKKSAQKVEETSLTF